MKNRLLLIGLAFCLGPSLNASQQLSNDSDTQYKQFHDQVANFFNNNGLFTVPYTKYKINLSTQYPKMNVFENDTTYVFKFELAGIDKKDIKISISNQNILTIQGSKKELTNEERQDMIRQEQYYGSFSRTISLPDDIDSNKIKVSYNNGILKVVIDKDIKKIKNGTRVLSID